MSRHLWTLAPLLQGHLHVERLLLLPRHCLQGLHPAWLLQKLLQLLLLMPASLIAGLPSCPAAAGGAAADVVSLAAGLSSCPQSAAADCSGAAVLADFGDGADDMTGPAAREAAAAAEASEASKERSLAA